MLHNQNLFYCVMASLHVYEILWLRFALQLETRLLRLIKYVQSDRKSTMDQTLVSGINHIKLHTQSFTL